MLNVLISLDYKDQNSLRVLAYEFNVTSYPTLGKSRNMHDSDLML